MPLKTLITKRNWRIVSNEALSCVCSFLAHSEKMNQKRGATPKAPYIGGCKLRFAETDKPSYVLVSRDTA